MVRFKIRRKSDRCLLLSLVSFLTGFVCFQLFRDSCWPAFLYVPAIAFAIAYHIISGCETEQIIKQRREGRGQALALE